MPEDHNPFPDRPTHTDFAKLASIVSMMDLEATGTVDVGSTFDLETIIGGAIDQQTVIYVARQRALRGALIARVPPESIIFAIMSTLWLEAFVAGHRFAKDDD